MERGEGSGIHKRRLCHCKRCKGQHFRYSHICDRHEVRYGVHIQTSSSSDSEDEISTSSTNPSEVVIIYYGQLVFFLYVLKLR